MDQASVAKTLKAKGQKMVITRKTLVTFDPIAGGNVGEPTISTWEVYGVTSNYSLLGRGGNFNREGLNILSGDKKVTMEAGVVEPVPGDLITIMGTDWTIIVPDSVAPQGVVLMYTLQVRK